MAKNISRSRLKRVTQNTIFVVYTDNRITDRKELRRTKQYCFNVAQVDGIAIGDLIKSPSYATKMQVTEVLPNTGYKFYNRTTGELSEKLTSTEQHEIVELRLGTPPDTNVVYASQV